MIILPAIDIKNGKCVRLYKGDFNTVEQVAESPIETALSFQRTGAQYLHMVDLDGAKDGTQSNQDIFLKVAKETDLRIELGGGIRDINAASFYLENGIERVILGSAAVKNPKLVKDLVKEYHDRIIVGIDAMHGMVQTEGWLDASEINYIDLAKEMEAIGVQYIVYTDISKDGTLSGPNLYELEMINNQVDIKIIASGGISNIEDIKALKKLNVYGVICGKSLYKNTLSLEEALKVARE
ncbi:1-(5-phosphoribosyl)-5-[(5-phosphoribosylamino)methylideneamino]imidazole-4-carboxamide isomerase [Paludicola sp. MB14-C6]|uniref:1-(5-phosphoribosyl)-5-[(5- phosphoribosylamino)methylideneamino]imidazole-4- carboxamide isomerase n=1 Tax=Paludihabitans sp. MB14-C6 TaxID=3070656 RepID=UPI0027DBC967|nr:1-(5-phosphoribosyl)-5-[(5-phosphoribosylamino)methylideneamino]imidazole-4-carboxamide isomerase [Paludicola sp. MB14-C6]WMJ23627.1 1-(5-phosphoribosyl)-5-[(5-phosphoribosylamino)methylideneamino]imidazole-4-carboxamide isomerase [Paludicola sp. MB14-C6]